MAHLDVDCLDVKCPVPLLRIRLALNKMQSGDTVSASIDDPQFKKELPLFLKLANIELVEKKQESNYTIYTLKAK